MTCRFIGNILPSLVILYIYIYVPKEVSFDYNIYIYYGHGRRHGIFQLLTAWADGPNMITQCPIRPGKSYTYKFNIIGQEGTLWWHAHVSILRATVYGALIILPREGPKAYPFPQPYEEVPILLGTYT